MLNQRFSELDADNALRPTTIKTGPVWTRVRRDGLLSDRVEASLGADAQADARAEAFALLDAITRSGALPVRHCQLHVVLASTHGFDRTLMATLVSGSRNPIEAVERSELIVATTVHGRDAAELVCDAARPRVATYSPALFGGDDDAGLLTC